MSKYIYPAIFKEEENGMYSIIFPDLESCYTQGENLQDAYEMAEDVLCLTLYGLEEEGKDIPLPSNIKSFDCGKGDFVSLIMADTLEYRKLYNNKAVKKTLTIPAWLNTMAEKENVNFSACLQKAIKEYLNIE